MEKVLKCKKGIVKRLKYERYGAICNQIENCDGPRCKFAKCNTVPEVCW